MQPISLVINTRNEESNLARCLESVSGYVKQIIVMDMESTDKTVQIAKKFDAEIYNHPLVGYVEPARNKALQLATQPWTLLLDADESISPQLQEYLASVISTNSADYVRLTRLNVIFGKPMKHGGWWPDYNVRFFKTGQVIWQDQIHSQPITNGESIDAPEDPELAIIHHHYQTISQFITRLDRYTTVQLADLSNHHFHWHDLINKPVNEFYSRYFAQNGWQDGLHGLSLSLLQAFSEFILYLKLWESSKFPDQQINLSDFDQVLAPQSKGFHSWMANLYGQSQNNLMKVKHAIKKRL